MLRRPLRRAAVLSLGVLLAFAGTAAADSVFADADNVTPVIDGSKFLGDVAPGGTVSADVRFLLVCAGIQHVDANQSVVLSAGPSTAPLDGAVVSVSTATLAPVDDAVGGRQRGLPGSCALAGRWGVQPRRAARADDGGHADVHDHVEPGARPDGKQRRERDRTHRDHRELLDARRGEHRADIDRPRLVHGRS